MPSSHLILCHPLLLLPPIPPSIRVFSSESTLRISCPKYWSFSFSIIPSKEIPGLIFRMDGLDLLAVQGILKSLLQHHSSKASIFGAQLCLCSNSHINDDWKNHSFNYTPFIGKVLYLIFNTLSMFVTNFLPRSKYLLVSWLQSPSAVILESKKIKSVTVCIFSPICLP